jgi:methionine-rich copper-binding protein CopC
MKQTLHLCRRLWLAALIAGGILLALGAALPGVASAHASYDHSTPAPGTILDSAPTQVAVFFKEGMDPKQSSLAVYHSDAKDTYNFDQEAKLVSPDNGTQFPLADSKSMTIAMQGDGNGIYAVVWHTVSTDDGDPDSGVFFFGVGKGTTLDAGAAVTPGPTTSSSGTPVWVAILTGIVGLIVGGGAVLVLAGRKKAA